MKNKYSVMLGVLTVGLIPMSLGETAKVEAVTVENEAKTEFKANNGPLQPVDPGDGTDIVPPKPPNNGPLGLSYVSDIYFGSHTVSKEQGLVAYAQSDEITHIDTGKKVTVPNFVQISDLRGDGKGWSLRVKMDNEFTNANGKTLTGAQLKIPVKGIEAQYKTPNPPSLFAKNLVIKQVDTYYEIVRAKEDEGMSTWNVFLGDMADETGNISLTIPEKAITESGHYKTSLTWSIESVL